MTETGGGGTANRGRMLALGIVAAGLVFGGGAAALLVGDDDCSPPDGAIAEVDDVVITQAQYDRRAELLGALYGLPQPEDADKADAYRRDLAKSMTTALIVDQEAKRRNVVVPDTEVTGALDRYVAKFFAEGGRPKFDEAMTAKGVTVDEVIAEFRQIQTTFSLLAAATAEVTVPDAEVTAGYQKVKDQLAAQGVTPEQGKEAVKAQLLAERRLAAQKTFTARIIKDADVCYDGQYRPADPDAPPAETVPTAAP